MNLAIWLILIIAAVLIDILTSNIMFSWLTLGFLAAIAGGFFGLDFTAQVILAAVIGTICFLIGSSVSKKYLRKRIDNKPILTDKIIGSVVIADKHIVEYAQHKVNGIYWTVYNEGEEINPGDSFRVYSIVNNKLKIKKVV